MGAWVIGSDETRVVAHEKVPERFDRYRLTAGYNAVINQRQFQVEGLQWPTDYRYPDETYSDTHTFEAGGERFELTHAKGETDDHTWTWVPSRRVLCCGDLFIWATPNAGNPQKVPRYPRDWSKALREMAALGAEVMLPGHGLPVVGAERVRAALEDTAALLESICDQTFELMNRGLPLDQVLAEPVEPPVLQHARMQEVLVDRRQLIGEDSIQKLDDIAIALHDFSSVRCWRGNSFGSDGKSKPMFASDLRLLN